jgi:asparagine N-glycosylation enzyme membrane subunit Stt3
MEQNLNQYVDRRTAGFGVAAAVAIIFSTLLTFAKESYPALNAAMKAATGHHWITHGVAVMAVFLILGWLLSKTNIRMSGKRLAWKLVAATVLAGLGLIGWFLFN